MKKWLKITLIVIVVLPAVLVLALQLLLNSAMLREKATALASEKTGMTVSLSDHRIRFIGTLPFIEAQLYGLQLIQSPSDTLLSVPSISLRANPFPIRAKEIDIEYLTASGLDYPALAHADSLALSGKLRLVMRQVTDSLSLPEFDARLQVPSMRLCYEPMDIAASGLLDLSASMDSSAVLNAAVNLLKLSTKGLDIGLSGSADDVLGADPLLKVDARAGVDLAALPPVITDSLGFTEREGSLSIDLAGETHMSAFEDFKFRNARIDGEVKAAEGLRVEHDAFGRATLYNTRIALHSADDGFRLAADTDTLRFDTEGMSLRIRGMRNSAGIEKTESRGQMVPRISVSSETDNIFARMDDSRFGMRSLSVSASATRRAPRVQRDSSGRRVRPPRPPRRSATDAAARADRDFAKADIDISLDSTITRYLRNWSTAGHLSTGRGVVITPSLPLRTRLSALHVDFDDRTVDIDTFAVRCGTSDLAMNGRIRGLKQSLMRKSRIMAEINLNSGRINANELVAAMTYASENKLAAKTSDELDESFVTDTLANAEISIEDLPPLFIVPGNVDLDISLNAQKLDFLDPRIGPVTTGAKIKDRTLQLTSTDIDTEIGRIYADAFYSTKSKTDVSAGVNIRLSGMSVDTLLRVVPVVDSLMPALRAFDGVVGCELSATARLDSMMNVIMPSVDGVLRISGTDMKFHNQGQFGKIPELILFGRGEVMDIEILTADAIIHDSKLEIFPFSLNVNRFDLVLQGRQGFDKSMNYHVSVLRWPLLIRFGINVYGSLDNWRFSLGRAKLSSGNLPAITSQLDTVQINLANSITNIFQRNVNEVVNYNRTNLSNVHDRKAEMDAAGERETADDALARDSYNEAISNMIYERELEEQMERDMAEIDAYLEDSLMAGMNSLIKMNEELMADPRLQRRLEREKRRREREETRAARKAAAVLNTYNVGQ